MYKLANSFPYLLNRVGARMGELFSQQLKPHDITVSMYRVLASLHERGDQRLSELSDVTHLELSTLSRLIGVIEDRQLVTRHRLEGNARVVAINLTPQGRKLVEQLIPLALEFENMAIHSFGLKEVASLKKGMTQIYDHLNALDPQALSAAPVSKK
jgi:DNA-binding MarR family transcriptional regulator